MSVRNLGDWSVLGIGGDPVGGADPDMVKVAHDRYSKTAAAIDDAVSKLSAMVNANETGQRGQWLDGLNQNAQSFSDNLTKAARRYDDVATQIGIYMPKLQTALDETAAALTQARAANSDLTTAQARPDPAKDDHGQLTDEGHAQEQAKNTAIDDANTALAAAKARLSRATDDLERAGHTLGDAVNCKQYNDGLKGTAADAVLQQISQILGWIGVAFAALAILIPGANVFALAALTVGGAALAVDSVLYADGEGSVLDVVLGAVGLGFGFIGTGLGAALRGIGNLTKANWLRGITTTATDTVNTDRDIRLGQIFRDNLQVNTGRPLGQDFADTMAGRPTPAAAGGGPSTAGNITNEFQSAESQITTIENSAIAQVNKFEDLSDWWNNPVTNWIGKTAFGYNPPAAGWLKSNWIQFKNTNVVSLISSSDSLGDFTKRWGVFMSGIDAPAGAAAIGRFAGAGMPSTWYYATGAGLKTFAWASFGYTIGRNIPGSASIPPVSGPGHVQAGA
jgi:hypothetical protein